MAAKTTDISETKIRQVIWMLKAKKTKKECCEHLGISYNTKRLDSIIKEFQEKESRTSELKKQRSKTPFTQEEKEMIVADYNAGESQSAIATRMYTTSARVKNVLIEMNVPIRARAKRGEAKVDHVVQDLDILFAKGDKVFIPKINSFGVVKEVYDEEWLDYYKHPNTRRYVELLDLSKSRKKYGEDFEGIEDVHWNIYWHYPNGDAWKEHAIKAKIKKVETILEETGREHYLVKVEGDYSFSDFITRDKLFPVMRK